MIQWKKDNLPTRQEKEAAAKKQQEHEQLPDRVAEMEEWTFFKFDDINRIHIWL